MEKLGVDAIRDYFLVAMCAATCSVVLTLQFERAHLRQAIEDLRSARPQVLQQRYRGELQKLVGTDELVETINQLRERLQKLETTIET